MIEGRGGVRVKGLHDMISNSDSQRHDPTKSMTTLLFLCPFSPLALYLSLRVPSVVLGLLRDACGEGLGILQLPGQMGQSLPALGP